jgi:hypothetical protein
MPERILGAELAEIERRSFLQFCASRGLPWHEFARFFLLNRRAINQPMAEFCELPGEDPVQDFIRLNRGIAQIEVGSAQTQTERFLRRFQVFTHIASMYGNSPVAGKIG